MPKYEFMCERCKKGFEVVLTAAERSAATSTCPTCGGRQVTPQMAIFSENFTKELKTNGRKILTSAKSPVSVTGHGPCRRSSVLDIRSADAARPASAATAP
jgi:putative FmdB family regulatory protein